MGGGSSKAFRSYDAVKVDLLRTAYCCIGKTMV